MNYKKILLIILVTVFFLQTSNASLIMRNSYEDNFYRSKIANPSIFQQASEITYFHNSILCKMTNEHYFYIDKIEDNVIEFLKKESLGWQVRHNGKACKVDETYFEKLGINESVEDQGYEQIFIELEEGSEFVFKRDGIFLENHEGTLVESWKHKFSIRELEKQLIFKPVEGKPKFVNGKGKLYYNDGKLRYEGEFKDGEFHGKGKLYYNDGKLAYEGEFKDDKYNGEGKYYYKNGACYEGEFKDGEFHGKGKYYYNDDKLRYEGEFKDDKYNGKGKRYYNKGELKYEGEFKDDKYNGQGRLFYKNGKLKHEGEFKDGEFHGKGKYYYKNGKLKYEGEFRDGKIHEMEEKYRKNKLLQKLKKLKENDRNSLIKKILFYRFEKLKLKARENPDDLVLVFRYVSDDLEKFISLMPVYEHVLTGLEILLDKKSIDWPEFVIYFQEKSKILNSLPLNITKNKSLTLAA